MFTVLNETPCIIETVEDYHSDQEKTVTIGRRHVYGPRAPALDYALRPGKVPLGELEAHGMTQLALARRVCRPLKTLDEIVNEKTAVTVETAHQLERALEISAYSYPGVPHPC